MLFHRGKYIQRGYGRVGQRGGGIGSFLANIAKKIIPFLFKTGKAIASTGVGQRVISAAKDSAVNGGLNLVQDVLKGGNVKDSISTGLREAKKSVLSALKPRKPAKKRRYVPYKTHPAKKKKKSIDLFDE